MRSDLITGTARTYPVEGLYSYAPSEAKWKSMLYVHAFRAPGLNGPHLFAYHDKVSDILDDSWLTSTFGFRYPAPYRSKVRLDFQDMTDRAPNLEEVMSGLDVLRGRKMPLMDHIDDHQEKVEAALRMNLDFAEQ